jgi:hypothetical protein
MRGERTTSVKPASARSCPIKWTRPSWSSWRTAWPISSYKKIIGRTYRLKAHDEENACGVGDRVRVMETRPLSKDKRWRVVEILEKAK